MVYPIIYRFSTIPGGAGFLPSTVGTVDDQRWWDNRIIHRGWFFLGGYWWCDLTSTENWTQCSWCWSNPPGQVASYVLQCEELLGADRLIWPLGNWQFFIWEMGRSWITTGITVPIMGYFLDDNGGIRTNIYTWDTVKVSVDYFSRGGSSRVEKVHQTM